MRKLTVVFYLFMLLATVANAQFKNPVSWSFDHKHVEGNVFELRFHATIDKTWHLYSEKKMNGGPIETSVNFENTEAFKLIGKFKALSVPKQVFDKSFNMDVEYFSNKVTFVQQVSIPTDKPVEIKGYVEFMCCDDETCLPPTEAYFTFNLKPVAQNATTSAQASTTGSETVADGSIQDGSIQDATAETGTEPIETEELLSTLVENADGTAENKAKTGGTAKALLPFLLLAFAAGLAAMLTPCVFPMIPMTVSFFMRGNGSRGQAIKTALFFGFSIVAIYTLLGALFSVGLFGPNAATILSTHWIPNTLFFVLFFLFALSFFGLFELVLPSSLVNKTDAKADQGGFVGAFFMALTTVIVSFSCTGPFIGYLIIEAVQGGGMRPLLGMFAFGLAFATPFTLLAIFPSALKKLPKSGGWLNAVKVVFAFILLAFGLKFLSNIDQVYGFNLLSRELYLSIWIVIFVLMGMYLLGKIKFSHDSDVKYVSVGRLLLAMASFSFSVFLITGLLGSPLSSISSLLPPQSAQPISQLASGNVVAGTNTPECGPAKYADKLHLPHGLVGYFDYEQGMACAKEQNKPVFMVFKGHACANCKKMENTVWNNPEALKMLSNDYIIIALYTDDRTTLPEAEWINSAIDGRQLKTMGRVNLERLMSNYQKNTIPYHVLISPDGQEHELEVTYNSDEFNQYLRQGLQ